MEITKATTMGEMLSYDMGIAGVLMQCGMHCVGCPSSYGESLEMACIQQDRGIRKAAQAAFLLSAPFLGKVCQEMRCASWQAFFQVGGQPFLCREDKTAQSAVISCRGGRKRQ